MEIDPSESAKTYFDVTCVMKNNECVNVTLVSDDKLIWGSLKFSDKNIKLIFNKSTISLDFRYWKIFIATYVLWTMIWIFLFSQNIKVKYNCNQCEFQNLILK